MVRAGKLVLASALVLSAFACRKSAETERGEAERAAARAEEKRTTMNKEAIDERNDWLAAVRREQLDLRGELQEEIDRIDKELANLRVDLHADGTYAMDPKDRAKNQAKVDDLLQRRKVLAGHVDAVETSDANGWEALKTRVEKDLGVIRGKT
jgi:hypothetical protein